jgi:hypothetical protein
MQRTVLVRRIVATILVLTGLVWIGQGLGYIPGSFMTGDRFWAAAGGVSVAVGLAILWSARRPID